MEIWKPIQQYEGAYEVSSEGRVRSLDRVLNTAIRHNSTVLRKGRVLKCNVKRNGYLSVDLSKDNIVRTVTVHRLVAKAFLGEKENVQVNHKNMTKSDNRVKNLEWCTGTENQRHARANKPWTSFSKQVLCVEKNMVFPSSYQAAEWLNKTHFNYSKTVIYISHKIRKVCRGEKTKAFGYQWKDIESTNSSTTSP